MTPPNTTHFSWTDVWTAAITRPRPETYEILLQDRDTRPGRAFLWMFVTSIVLALVTANILFNNPSFSVAFNAQLEQTGATISATELSQTLLLISLCATPFAALFNVLRYMVLGIVIHEIARRVVGAHVQEKRNALFYLLGAVVAPLTLVSAFVNIIPTALGTILALLLLGFQAYVFMQIAIALYNVETRQAILIAVMPTVALYLLQVLLVGALI